MGRNSLWGALLTIGATAAVVFAQSGCTGGGAATTGNPPDTGAPSQAAAVAAIERLNHYRNQANTPPVLLDEQLSLGCQAHADYLQINSIDLHVVGLDAHNEYPELQAYSEAGEAAGASSIIYQGVTSVEAVDNWMATFYHRLGLLDVNLLAVGFGSAGGYQVMDVVHGRAQDDAIQSGTALFPSVGMRDAPVAYRQEIPHPIPGDRSLGVPITVEFSGGIGWHITGVGYLVLDTDSGATVPCYLQTPGQPFLPEWDMSQVIALIPREPLAKGHTYRVSVSATVDGSPWAGEWLCLTR